MPERRRTGQLCRVHVLRCTFQPRPAGHGVLGEALLLVHQWGRGRG